MFGCVCCVLCIVTEYGPFRCCHAAFTVFISVQTHLMCFLSFIIWPSLSSPFHYSYTQLFATFFVLRCLFRCRRLLLLLIIIFSLFDSFLLSHHFSLRFIFRIWVFTLSIRVWVLHEFVYVNVLFNDFSASLWIFWQKETKRCTQKKRKNKTMTNMMSKRKKKRQANT